jgi:hypothetical protein
MNRPVGEYGKTGGNFPAAKEANALPEKQIPVIIVSGMTGAFAGMTTAYGADE